MTTFADVALPDSSKPPELSWNVLGNAQALHGVSVDKAGEHALAANYGGTTPGHSLTLIDLRNRTSVRTIEMGEFRRPHGIAWLPDSRRVVVTSELGGSMEMSNDHGTRVHLEIPLRKTGTASL